MIYRKLDDRGDYVFGGNRRDFLDGREAVEQAVKTRLLLLLDEWWEDRADGLPLWQEIAGSRGSEHARDLILRRIVTTKHVTGIMSFDMDFDNESRRMLLNVTFMTEYGEGHLEQEVM